MNNKPKSHTASQVASVVNLPGYQIKDVLGKGGMAVVYLAIQESIGRQVALKILAPDHTDESFTDRFLAEARIISSMNHPNIITVFDAGVHQGCHYMAMEYVPGKSLREARDILSRKQKVQIIKQMAQALDYAGKKGYVHRDIKPENILLHEDGRAILTDFGIARSLDATRGLTVTGKTIGTPYYMSPEQTKGTEVDHRSDIYSLGVVLFQCLAGYIPYDGPSMVAIGIKHLSEPIPELPIGLEVFQPIINICLSKDPAHRYATAGEFYHALEAIADAELDYIDAKLAALKKKGKDYHAKTMVSDELSVPVTPPRHSVSQPSQRRTVPSQTTSTVLDITESDDFRRLRKRRRRVLMLVIVFALFGVGVVQRDYLAQQWQIHVSPELAKLTQTDTDPNPGTTSPKTSPIQTDTTALAVEQSNTQNQIIETPAEPEPTTPPVSTGLSNEPDILQRIETQPELIEPLVREYQQRLAIDPQDSVAHDGLAYLGKYYILQIRSAVDQQNTTLARKLIAEARQQLDNTYLPSQILLIEQQLLRQEAIKSHIDKAEEYFGRGDYLVPAGANALDEWQAVLAIDPEHKQAKQGIHDIVGHYFSQASEQFKAGKFHEAVATTELGLTADKHNPRLLGLKNTLNQAIEKQNRILSLLIRADAQFQAGKVIAPARENAFDLYQAVLKEQADHPKAKQGLRKIESYLSRQINTAVWENKLALAGRLLEHGLARFPNSALLDQSKAKFQHAVDTRAPRITHILFSDKSIGSLLKEQNPVYPTQRLHIGFSYTNLTTSTTLLTAILTTPSGQALEKKLIVSDKSGEHLFYFEHPNGVFGPGIYQFTVKLDNKVIFTNPLQIQVKPNL